MKKITVIGSISTDFVAQSERFPKVGETIEGSHFGIHYGGKGANQAVAASRIYPKVNMIGAVGDDLFGDNLINNLKSNNILTDYVEQVKDTSSGAAVIVLAEDDNHIVYTPGANNEVSVEMINNANETLLDSNIVVLQNEIPQETIEHIIELCYDNNVPVLLNPAPARELATDYINKITYLTPNETEFELLFNDQSHEDVLEKYPNKLIITLGSDGVKYHNGEEVVIVPSVKPKEIKDTTGAGDTFNGGLAVGITNELELTEAIKLGNLAASISIEKLGAQGGSPTLKELKERKQYDEEWGLK